MNLPASVLTLFCITTMVLGWGTGLAQPTGPALPWAALPRVQSLDEAMRNDLLEMLKREKGQSACQDSIYDCLAREKPDPSAVRLTNFAAFLLSKGVSLQGLQKFFSKKAEFESVERREFREDATPLYGNPNGPIRLIEFGEFKCPMCSNVRPILKKLVDESNGVVRLSFKHFPLLAHGGTMLASRAAVAAQRQGKFWEMAELLYRNMERKEEHELLEMAAGLGLDMTRFRADLDDPEVTKLVRADKVEGVNAKVDSTPTLFINGKYYGLRMNDPYLKDTINDVAERMGIAPPYKDWVY
jgi:predicted DsbA family dithiol-disulfide isomerase